VKPSQDSAQPNEAWELDQVRGRINTRLPMPPRSQCFTPTERQDRRGDVSGAAEVVHRADTPAISPSESGDAVRMEHHEAEGEGRQTN